VSARGTVIGKAQSVAAVRPQKHRPIIAIVCLWRLLCSETSTNYKVVVQIWPL